MATMSLRAGLEQIGAIREGQPATALPSGFHAAPNSLRAVIRAATSPRLDRWQTPDRREFANMIWTEEAQGITTDGDFWYFSSNNAAKRAIYKFDASFLPVDIGLLPLELGEIVQNPLGGRELALHLGDIDFAGGLIYAAVEPRLLVARFTTEPRFLDVHPLRAGPRGPVPQSDMPWCAINPLNGWLYSSNFSNVDRVFAYDPQRAFAFCDELPLGGPPVERVQGGVFSANGRLYLTSDQSGDVRCYCAMNGAFFGARQIPYTPGALEAEEVEGIAIRAAPRADGAATVYVVVLDNDWPDRDDVFLVSYRVPEDLRL